MNKDYTFPRAIFDALTEAKRKYAQPENRLAFVMGYRTANQVYRKFLTRTENIMKVIDVLYVNQEFFKESEFIPMEKVVDLAYRFYEVKVYNKDEDLVATLISHEYKFYLVYHGKNEYSSIKLENIFDTLSDLNFEVSVFNGNANTRRKVEKLEQTHKLVKFQL